MSRIGPADGGFFIGKMVRAAASSLLPTRHHKVLAGGGEPVWKPVSVQ